MKLEFDRHLVRIGLAAALLLLVPGGGGAESLVEARQRLMVSIVKATKTMREMAEGKAALDVDVVKASARVVVEAAAVLPNLFPDGTQGPPSAALPAVWEQKPDFDARLNEMNRSALMLVFAARQGGAAFRSSFGEFQRGCDHCHAKFRKPE